MTEDAGNLEARVDALESRVDELTGQLQQAKQDGVAARVLAGGADRDVGVLGGEMREFRQATSASFDAMREDLVDLRRETADGFARVNDGFAAINTRLDTTAAGLSHITELLNGLITDRGND